MYVSIVAKTNNTFIRVLYILGLRNVYQILNAIEVNPYFACRKFVSFVSFAFNICTTKTLFSI